LRKKVILISKEEWPRCKRCTAGLVRGANWKQYRTDYVCDTCTKIDSKNRREANYEDRILAMYGVSYAALVDQFEGKCGICGRSQSIFRKRLAVDHDHLTGRVRGLLCQQCNHGLGNFKDSIALLEKAKAYLGDSIVAAE